MTDFDKLIHSKIRGMVSDRNGYAGRVLLVHRSLVATNTVKLNKTTDSYNEGIETEQTDQHIIAPKTVIKFSNGGGPMNQFHNSFS